MFLGIVGGVSRKGFLALYVGSAGGMFPGFPRAGGMFPGVSTYVGNRGEVLLIGVHVR